MKKLSPTQIEVLRRLAEPGNFAHYMQSMGRFNPNAYWFFHEGNSEHIRDATMTILKTYQLVEYTMDSLGWYPKLAHITEAGRAYLAERDKTKED